MAGWRSKVTKLMLLPLVLAGVLVATEQAEAGSVTYTVTCLSVSYDDDDEPTCMTWDGAIGAANAHPGHDSIRFNIPGPGPHQIVLAPGNDKVTDPVTIDGYSQPESRRNSLANGTNANVLIQFRGRGLERSESSFKLWTSNSEIHGVAFTDFYRGLSITGDDNRIWGNVFGSVFASMQSVVGGRNNMGVKIEGRRNRLGADQLKDRNLISGNVEGIHIPGDSSGTHQSNVVVNNLIGTTAAGDQPHPNEFGVFIQGSAGNSIGLPGLANRNVISGNTYGVYFQGAENSFGTTTENRVRNNIIGLDASGYVAVPNDIGVRSVNNGSSGNHIGGPSPGDGNVISGNARHGVLLRNGSHQVQGNRIGVNTAGEPVPNGANGVRIEDALSGVIGGGASSPGDAPGNVIHGSAQGDWAAVELVGGGRTEITGNRITGAEHGVLINGSVRNVVGGTVPADANVIHANRRNAVRVTDGSTQNRILGNSMYGNARLGIDLGGDGVTGGGVTANDVGDADTGANNLQNYPRLDAAVPTAAGLRVDGSLHSTPNTEFVVQFFSQPSVGGPELRPCVQDSGHGEGRTVLGQTRVTTNSEGDARFSSVVRSTGANDWVSATATGNENTSEFSECVTVSPVADLWIVKTQPPGATAGSNFTYTVTVRSKGPSPATSVVMEDTLQPTTTFVSMTWPPAWTCTHPAPNTGGSIRCTRGGSLAAEGTAEVFKIVGRVPSDTPDGARLIGTAATVSSPVSDPDLSNNRSSAAFDVSAQADLAVVKSASPDVVRRGGALTYTLTVTNAGPSDAKNPRIEDALAEELAFVSLSSPPDWTCATPDPGAFGTVACATAKLPAGAPAQVFKITVNARNSAAGEIVNQAAVASETPDGDRANNTSTVGTPVSDDEANPDGQGAVQATIAVAEDTPPPDEIRSVVVDPTAVAFGACERKDGAAAAGMTYPHGKCVTPLISITNAGAPSSIYVLGADAVPSDAGPSWTLCYSASCTAAGDLPGSDQYTARTFAPGGPGEQFLAATPRCDYAFATTAASPSCWATSGQSQTERVEIIGPETSSSAATSFSTTLTWIATP